MSCLCLGPKRSGKTHLLQSLQNGESINITSQSVPTIGTNIFVIHLPKDGKSKNVRRRGSISTVGNYVTPHRKDSIEIREIGGTMAPMWKNYLNNVRKIIYVIDTSNLCQISAAGVLLYSLLADPRLQKTKFLLVLTKMDLAYRQMRNEALLMLQYETLTKQIPQSIEMVETSAITRLNSDKILNWLTN